MSAFNEAFRDARRAGQEAFEYRGRVYNTRLKGEDSKAWKTNLAAVKVSGAGGNATQPEETGAGSPLPRARPNNTPNLPRPRPDLIEENPAELEVDSILGGLYEQARELYAQGAISKAGFDQMTERYNSLDYMRYGEPANEPDEPEELAFETMSEHPDTREQFIPEPLNPHDEAYVPDGRPLMDFQTGDKDELKLRKANLMATITAAYARGGMTTDQAKLMFERLDAINTD